MFFTILLLFSRNLAIAATLEQEYLQKLNRARDAAAIERLQSSFEHIRVLRLACRLQIQSKQVPLSCFEALHHETDWGLHTRKQSRVLEHELEDRCQRAAESLRLPSNTVSLAALSKNCLAQVENARKIQKYRAQESELVRDLN